ncbi:olfactory receptor 1020-like [Microcaecilia unicolor]|uniref:Olfactory receptor n=1 Tax=Microcaecilia unicolor TaxID=1415580 RepID=A0A6P7WW27_9AMPH|nr:olfactory receptor 1020-like [Microcaecilia unicolor]
MDVWNKTSVKEFILLGLTTLPVLKTVFFVLFSAVYFITVVGNISIIVITKIDPQLQTSMYFFLSNLSFIDICLSSIVTLNMLVNFLSEHRPISFYGCATQLFSSFGFGTTECFLLAVMAYDRYVAICKPLLYATIITKRRCLQLVAFSYLGGFLHSTIHTVATFRLPFCSHEIHHFFCDIPPLLKLSCFDNQLSKILLFTFISIVGFSCVLIIIPSYIYIISTIVKMKSTDGRHKTFSTCASHITVVSLLFGTVIFTYITPPSLYSQDQDKVISVFYSVMIPMLNPLIYSVRNNEVKASIKKILGKISLLQNI